MSAGHLSRWGKVNVDRVALAPPRSQLNGVSDGEMFNVQLALLVIRGNSSHDVACSIDVTFSRASAGWGRH